MKVTVKTFLMMKEATAGQSSLEVELDGGTIVDLLNDLGERFGEEFVRRVFEAEGRELSNQVLILVNGRHVSNLPQGLTTPLNEGDEVAIFPPIAGG